MPKAIRREPEITPLRTVTNATSTKDYKPFWQPVRPGADDALKVPTRMGNRLHYRDGRVKELA